MSTTGNTTTSSAPPDAAGRPLRADARRNRERVLEAARAAFAEHGPEASLDEIARGAGVGIGTLYRHFPNRQALLEAVLRDNIDLLTAQGRELLTSDDPGAALVAWLHAQLEHATTYRALAASVMITQLGDDACGEPRACEQLRAVGEELLARAQDVGAMRADVDIDDVIRFVNAIALATEDAGNGAAASDRLFTLMVGGLRA